MAKIIELKILRSTTANLTGTVLADGEPVRDTTINGLLIGDGSTDAGSLPYIGMPILDENDMASDSDVNLATQQSIKAYSDSATQTMTNKTLTSPVLNTGVSGTAVDTDGTLAANSDTVLSSQKAVKTYADAVAAETVSRLTVGAGSKNAGVGWRNNAGPTLSGQGKITGGSYTGIGDNLFTHSYGHTNIGIIAASASDGMYVEAGTITNTTIQVLTKVIGTGALGNPGSMSFTVVDLS